MRLTRAFAGTAAVLAAVNVNRVAPIAMNDLIFIILFVDWSCDFDAIPDKDRVPWRG